MLRGGLKSGLLTTHNLLLREEFLLSDSGQLGLLHQVEILTSEHTFKFTCTETGVCRKIASTELLSSSPLCLHLPRRLSDSELSSSKCCLGGF